MISQQQWKPTVYSKTSDTRVMIAQEVLSAANYTFHGNESVLDIGCGTGSITAAIAKIVSKGSALGIDSSKNMVNDANLKYQDSNLQFITKDATNIPTISKKFDLVTSFACLHWVPDQIAVLKGIEHALNSNGQAILMLYPKCEILWEALDSIINIAPWTQHFDSFNDPYCFFNCNDYKEFIKQTSLRLISIKYLEINIPNSTKEKYKNLITSWLPHLQVIPEKLHDQFMNELLDQISQLFPKYNIKNFLNWPYPRIDIHLCKGSNIHSPVNC